MSLSNQHSLNYQQRVISPSDSCERTKEYPSNDRTENHRNESSHKNCMGNDFEDSNFKTSQKQGTQQLNPQREGDHHDSISTSPEFFRLENSKNLDGQDLLKAVQSQKDLMDSLAREKRLQKQLEEEKERQAKLESTKRRLAEFEKRAAERKALLNEDHNSLQSTSCPTSLQDTPKAESRPLSKSQSLPKSHNLGNTRDLSKKTKPRTSSFPQQRDSSEKITSKKTHEEALSKKTLNLQTNALALKIRQTLASNPPNSTTPAPLTSCQPSTQSEPRRNTRHRKNDHSPRNTKSSQTREQKYLYEENQEDYDEFYMYNAPSWPENPYQNWYMNCYLPPPPPPPPPQMYSYGYPSYPVMNPQNGWPLYS